MLHMYWFGNELIQKLGHQHMQIKRPLRIALRIYSTHLLVQHQISAHLYFLSTYNGVSRMLLRHNLRELVIQ